MAYIEELFSENFIQYASYVIRDRAIPSLNDGLKPVQRRILQSLWDMDDGKFHKVANVVGHCMQYHPHGDASIYGALVNLANKELFIERQGNFGNIYTGDPASAARYIECRLSPLARRTLFNPDITDFLPSYDGRRNEPLTLPAKLPFLLILGAEGIAVGMSTRILPHNFGEVISAMCAHLRNEEFELLPDFPTGGLLDASQYQRGQGKIISRARLEFQENQILIRELPYGVTTESLIASLEAAAKKGRIPVQNIQNFTAEEVEIVLQMPRGGSTRGESALREALYAFSDCEVSISCNLLTLDEKRPVEMETHAVLRHSCEQLKQLLKAELELEAHELKQQIFSRNLERIFIEERLYRLLEGLTKLKQMETAILDALQPYCGEEGELGRVPNKDELAALMRIPIRRISLYDITRMQKELRECKKRLKQVEKQLKSLTEYALSCLEGLLEEFGPLFPRKSTLSRFAKADVRQAAPRNQMLRYDEQEGFLGYTLKKGRALFACSPYDRILLLRGNGSYSVFDVPEKLFVGAVAFCHLAERDELAKLEAALIYVDEKTGYSYGKRIRFGGYILGKEYPVVPENSRLLGFVAFVAGGGLPDHKTEQEVLQKAAQKFVQAEPLFADTAFCLLSQHTAHDAAFVLSLENEKSMLASTKKKETRHYRFTELAEKGTKAKGRLLCKQKVSAVGVLGLREEPLAESGRKTE